MSLLDDTARRLAEAAAHVIAKAEELGLPEAPDKLGIPPQALNLLARAYVELHDQVCALHDLVNLTDPSDPIGAALTQVGLVRRPPDWTKSGPRLVRTSAQIEVLDTDQLAALYRSVMGGRLDFAQHATFVVRVWDGMDGCWTDCTGEVGRDEALRYWAEKTHGGTRCVAYDEIDYYGIFPGGTRMHWDGSEGRERHR